MQPEEQYLAFLAEGRFMLQRAKGSGTYVFFPRVAIPGTGETDLEWVEPSGIGTVYSTTVVRSKPPAENYNVALIDLAEGVRMMGRVVDIDPAAVRVGMEVSAKVGEIDGKPAVLFVEARS